MTSQQRYLPFGQVRTEVASPNSQSLITDLGYTGQRNLDEGIGLMDYRARFYSPVLNRFIQPDTIVPNLYNPQAHNRFSSVLNSPINFNDPTGHAYCDFINSQNEEDCNGGLANSQSNSVIWKKKDKDKEKEEECATVTCKALNGDITSLLNLIIPTHIGWRWQIEFNLTFINFGGFGAGPSGTIGLNFAINRVSKELAIFGDLSGEVGPGVGNPLGLSITTGPLGGWGSSKISDIARGSAVTGGATVAPDLAFSMSVTAPTENLNLLDGIDLHVDPIYGQVPTTLYAGGGGGLAYGGAGIGPSQVFASAIINTSNLSASACFIAC